MKTRLIVLLALFAVIAMSCGVCSPQSNAPVMRTDVSGKAYLLKAEDFDLKTVIALIKDNKVKDAADLEKQINSTSGINNVDLDHDGLADYISVKERRTPSGLEFDLLAIPSKDKDESKATKIASISFSREASSSDVRVRGGYADHVQGYDQYYYNSYHHGPSLGTMMFLAWAFSPGRSMYHQPFAPAYVVQRPVVRPSPTVAPRASGFKARRDSIRNFGGRSKGFGSFRGFRRR